MAMRMPNRPLPVETMVLAFGAGGLVSLSKHYGWPLFLSLAVYVTLAILIDRLYAWRPILGAAVAVAVVVLAAILFLLP